MSQLSWVGAFVLFQLASVPLCVSRWGTELYGDWLILFTVPVYVTLANLGIHVAVGNRVSALVATDHVGRAVELYRSYTRLVVQLGALVGLALVAGAYATDVRGLLGLEVVTGSQAHQIAAVFVCFAALGIVAGTFPVAFRLTNRFHLGVAANAAFRVAELVAIVVAVALDATPLGVAVVLLVARTVTTVGLWRLAARELAAVRPSAGSAIRSVPTISDLRGLGTASLAAAVFPFGTVALCQGILLVISRSMPSIYVVAVNTLRTISNSIYQLSQAMSIGVLPELATSLATGDRARATRMRSRYLAVIWIAGGAFSVVALIVLGPALRIWTRGEVSSDHLLMGLLLLAALLDATALALASGTVARNTHQRFALKYVGIAALSLVIVALTVRADRLWVVGAALALGGVLTVRAALVEAQEAFGDERRYGPLSAAATTTLDLVRHPRALAAIVLRIR